MNVDHPLALAVTTARVRARTARLDVSEPTPLTLKIESDTLSMTITERTSVDVLVEVHTKTDRPVRTERVVWRADEFEMIARQFIEGARP